MEKLEGEAMIGEKTREEAKTYAQAMTVLISHYWPEMPNEARIMFEEKIKHGILLAVEKERSRLLSTPVRHIYMILVGPSGSVFAKTLDFYRDQQGFNQEWGKNWIPIMDTSIEAAKKQACDKLPGARPFSEQVLSDMQACDKLPGEG